MTWEAWDTDQAVTRGPLDEDLDGAEAFERYGVTAREELAGEPLAVALAQEEPEPVAVIDLDDQWALVEPEVDGEELAALEGDGPESAALHVVTL